VQEYCLRHFIPTLAHRMDLGRARSSDAETRRQEKDRFLGLLRRLPAGEGPGSAFVVFQPQQRGVGSRLL
jgi:hypothetical protein